MTWTGSNPVTVGNPTKKSDFDALWDNADYLHDKMCLVSSYADLATAITDIGATEQILVIDEDVSLSDDNTFPTTLSVIVRKGCVITIANTKTLTINGDFQAGLYQVFDGDGLAVFGSGSIPTVYPEWWGIDGTTDETEIAAAIAAAVNIKCVKLQSKTYTLTSAGITLATECLNLSADSMATLTTAADIDALTINNRYTILKNIKVAQTGSSTKAGIKLLNDGSYEGAKNCVIENVFADNFKYGMELYASSGGVGYNTVTHFHGNGSSGASVYIHTSGAGWVNENHFFGGNLHADNANGVNCVNIASNCNNNKFLGTSFEGGGDYDWTVIESGVNVFQGCRFETKGYGIYVSNSTSNDFRVTQLGGSHWSTDKSPEWAVAGGRLRLTNEYVKGSFFTGEVAADDRVSTTVSGDSAAAQKDLTVTSETGFHEGDRVLVNSGGAREEWCVVAAVAANTLTMVENLRYTHTSAQGDAVVAKGKWSGVHSRTADGYIDLYVYGVQALQVKSDGTAKLLGALSASTAPTP